MYSNLLFKNGAALQNLSKKYFTKSEGSLKNNIVAMQGQIILLTYQIQQTAA